MNLCGPFVSCASLSPTLAAKPTTGLLVVEHDMLKVGDDSERSGIDTWCKSLSLFPFSKPEGCIGQRKG